VFYTAQNTETWWFSVIDVVQVLTQQEDDLTARKYWNQLKRRLAIEGSQLVTNCHELKMPAANGKQRLTDVANTQSLLRIVQSVPSPKAERMQEMADPALSLNRARQTWQQHGRSDKWIAHRMTGQETRNKLTDYWSEHDIKKGSEFAILTSIIHQEWSGVSEAELIFTALAELSTHQIAQSVQATGMAENKTAAQSGGRIAAQARNQLESQTGQSVVTGANYLAPVVPSASKAAKATKAIQSTPRPKKQ
jgi:DNA-damage-inducible protein D